MRVSSGKSLRSCPIDCRSACTEVIARGCRESASGLITGKAHVEQMFSACADSEHRASRSTAGFPLAQRGDPKNFWVPSRAADRTPEGEGRPDAGSTLLVRRLVI